MPIKDFLDEMWERTASDLHLVPELPPQLRIDGALLDMDRNALSADEVRELCFEMLSDQQRSSFEQNQELDFSFSHGTEARIRANLYIDRGSIVGAFRMIPMEIPSAEELGIPDVVMNLLTKQHGLILLTGPTGCGKSTSLAAMLNHINQTQRKHIITVEDPIEYLYKSNKSLVNQREVGSDTHSFANGLKHILRQDPDVVLIGEMRDLETIAAALTISETGHLVFATVHTNATAESVDRIVDVFPPHQQAQIRTQLSFILQGIFTQQLIPKKGGGRTLAMEILMPTYAIRNLIRENKTHQIYSHMLTGQEETSMKTMNQALAELVKNGTV